MDKETTTSVTIDRNAISHCNSPKKAQMLKEAIQEKMKLTDIVVLNTAGVSSMYANDGGIIVAV